MTDIPVEDTTEEPETDTEYVRYRLTRVGAGSSARVLFRDAGDVKFSTKDNDQAGIGKGAE